MDDVLTAKESREDMLECVKIAASHTRFVNAELLQDVVAEAEEKTVELDPAAKLGALLEVLALVSIGTRALRQSHRQSHRQSL